ncbi:hypothetical protein MPNT_350010 [Candidatus Methylacidithermus pantelleriae]|uniref:Uncharacterized protein n=1 Tax=Candidatus Methylacidithermus pantelleriae TaxID=2744239 RepID=A0A8J2BUK6_9BACT|nr:hypothetical protein MPNT_350010 [Candidatus Methylacidithermus pantelleriae]
MSVGNPLHRVDVKQLESRLLHYTHVQSLPNLKWLHPGYLAEGGVYLLYLSAAWNNG